MKVEVTHSLTKEPKTEVSLRVFGKVK